MTVVPPRTTEGTITVTRRSIAIPDGLVSAASHAVIVLQLALALAVFRAFDLERTSGFVPLAALILGGFVVHAALPMTSRTPFFLALTFAAFILVLGLPAVVVIAVALALIAVCHLPIAFRTRAGILVLSGALLAVIMARGIPGVEPAVVRRVLPVLASMFMFRLIIYMYDLRNERAPVSPWMRVSYFFLLPNVWFPLFPVVDYGAFKRNYFDKPAIDIYQRGVRLILRGAIHLLLYKYLYYHWSPAPETVWGLRTVILYMASAWLAYLHVSGLFHLIAGVLCLFGFNLPDTNRLYFLASGPNDLWRRVNVYWKDFMLKIFYLPSYKALQKRKIDMKTSMLVATIIVFLVTWLLHSYQWFWLFGRFPISLEDGVFWGIFGVAVVVNTLVQLNSRPRIAGADRNDWKPARAVIHVLKVMGMFALMSIMFSWWSTHDAGTWFYIAGSVGKSGARAFMQLGVAFVLLLIIGVAAHYTVHRGWTLGIGNPALPFKRSVALTLSGSLLLLALSTPEVQRRLGRSGKVLAGLEHERLNRRDTELQQRAYYEALIATQPGASTRFRTGNDAEWNMTPMRNSVATRSTGDELAYELIPSKSTRLRGALIQTNSFGMRDKEYSLVKPDSTYRIALIGASVIMASGSDQATSFEALTEERLNRERPSSRYSGYEILNFAVAGYGFEQFAETANRKVFRFQPDVVVMGALAGDHDVSINTMARLIEAKVPLDPELDAIVKRAGITSKSRRVELRRKLRLSDAAQHARSVAYKRIADLSRQNGAIPVFMYLPRLESEEFPPGFDEMSRDAKAAGMLVLDFRNVYAGLPRDSFMVPETFKIPRDDVHPNALGHKRISDQLYSALIAHAAELGLAQDSSTKPLTSGR